MTIITCLEGTDIKTYKQGNHLVVSPNGDDMTHQLSLSPEAQRELMIDGLVSETMDTDIDFTDRKHDDLRMLRKRLRVLLSQVEDEIGK